MHTQYLYLIQKHLGGGGGVSIIWLRPVKGNEEESCHICHVRVNWPVVCLIVIMLAIKQTRWSYRVPVFAKNIPQSFIWCQASKTCRVNFRTVASYRGRYSRLRVLYAVKAFYVLIIDWSVTFLWFGLHLLLDFIKPDRQFLQILNFEVMLVATCQ